MEIGVIGLNIYFSYFLQPQAMRRPRGSSPADITGSCRLPIKKRPYMPNQEDVGSSSNKVKIACASKKT